MWGDMTAPQIAAARDAGDVVLIPVGAVEQHGPHLPVDTDISGAYESAKEAGRRRSYVVLAPPVWWGLSAAHRKFPGYLSLRFQTFYSLLEDLCDCLVGQGFTKIVFVVGHASNKPIVQLLVSDYMDRHGVALLQVNYLNLAAPIFSKIRKSDVGGDAHAGELETAVQMHLRPGKIDVSDAPVHYIDPKRDFGLSTAPKDIFSAGESHIGWDLKDSFPEGVLGDPTVATAETGQLAFEEIIEKLCGILDEYHAL